MSVPSTTGVHFDHHENIDPPGNANLAVWCGLVALTFMTGTFVAANVYLRAWSPSKFKLNVSLLTQLPYYYVILAVISAVLLITAGSFFVKNRWTGFKAMLALSTLSYMAMTLIEFRLMLWLGHVNQQIATIDVPSAVVEFVLSAIGVILLATAGWYASYANKTKLNRFFPVAMNVWLYTAFSGIVMLLLENVMTVGQFAAWCGQHI